MLAAPGVPPANRAVGSIASPASVRLNMYDVRAAQRPLKERYRQGVDTPRGARIGRVWTLREPLSTASIWL